MGLNTFIKNWLLKKKYVEMQMTTTIYIVMQKQRLSKNR